MQVIVGLKSRTARLRAVTVYHVRARAGSAPVRGLPFLGLNRTMSPNRTLTPLVTCIIPAASVATDGERPHRRYG